MRRLVVGLAILTMAALAPSWAQADDQQIAEQIVERLEAEKAKGNLKGFNIDLEVDQGTVWMKGHVSKPEQQKLALDIARRIRGVRQVVNDLQVTRAEPSRSLRKVPPRTLLAGFRSVLDKTPKGSQPEPKKARSPASSASPNDTAIAQKIVQKLRVQKEQGRLRGFALDVNVQDGSVWLVGSVSSREQQRLVLDIARRVRGVKQVVNQVSVKSASVVPAAATKATPVAARPTAAARPSQASQTARSSLPQNVRAVPMQAYRMPLAIAPAAHYQQGTPAPLATPAPSGYPAARFDHPQLPGYAWPSYGAYPNYAAVTYPKQYSPTAWPYIGPFYPYPQVPLGWRKVTLKWDDGWWFLDFKDK